MLAVFADRGGDPDRPGKKDPLDCLVWRAERPGEPALDSALGRGRPGWHVECTAMALDLLGERFDVQGGGTDLIFPHHEMCASEAQVLTGAPYALAYVHAGMVAYDGAKMSKSKGNLVFVSALRNSDVDPMAIRLTVLRHHYRSDWEWTDDQLWASVDQLDGWRRALAVGAGAPAAPVVDAVLTALAGDLDAPSAVAAVDAWADATLGQLGPRGHQRPRGGRHHACPARRGPRPRSVDPPSRQRTTRRGSGACLRRLGGSGLFAAPLQVPLELPRDRLAARLRQVGRVAGLLEGADVVRDVLVLLGELVDTALPGARVLR